MGTRSLTAFVDDTGKEIVRLYRQFDGYPTGHGADLVKLCDVAIVNGIGANKRVANGMGCLAAQVIAGLKDGPGGIYIEAPGTSCRLGGIHLYHSPPEETWRTPNH